MMSRREEVRGQVQAFHIDHPEVWKLFVKFTLDRIKLGFTHYGVSGIFEAIRWHTDEAHIKEGENRFKIGNNYKPFYARRFMKMYPEHDGFFRTRKQITADRPALKKPEFGPQDL